MSQTITEMGRTPRTPILVSGTEVRKLPIGPEEAFVVSRVDGRTDEDQIALSTGLPKDRVGEHLNRLVKLGAVRFVGDVVVAPVQRLQVAPPKANGKAAPPNGAGLAARPRPRAPTLEECRAEIQRLSESLSLVDHYELLEVPRSASREQIKASYFAKISRFHPDNYYGQQLGELKYKLEAVFQRMTEAHDTLSRAKRREVYDASLGKERPRSIPVAAESAPTVGLPPKPPSDKGVNAADMPLGWDVPPTIPPAPPPARFSEPPPAPPPRASERPPLDPAQRRSALARHLRNSTHDTLRPTSPPPAETHTASMPPAGHRGTGHFLAAARSSRAHGDAVGAVNSLRLALNLSPNDARVQKLLKEAEETADRQLAAEHVAAAEVAERNGEYTQAASSYARAARGLKKRAYYIRAAELAFQARRNLRDASEWVKRALELGDDAASLRLLLGKIYTEAGMAASAIAEFEKARKLEPGNTEVARWLKKVRSE